MQLRSFLYLDNELVEEFLANFAETMEPGETIRSVSRETAEKAGSLDFKVAKGQRGSSQAAEVERAGTVGTSPAARFARLLDQLDRVDAVTSVVDGADWASLLDAKPGQLVELQGALRAPQITALLEAMDHFGGMAGLMEQAGGDATIDEDAKKVLSFADGLSDLLEKAPLRVVVTSLEVSQGPVVVTQLKRDKLKAQLDAYGDEVTVLCKLRRRLAAGEEYELSNVFEKLEKAPLIGGEIKKLLAGGPDEIPEVFREVVAGPGWVAVPVAIYV